MSSDTKINFSKQSLLQLQELLRRQNALLQNRPLLQHLSDKGESVKKLRDKIQKEIEFRSNIENIESTLSALTLSPSTNPNISVEGHVKYVCSKEKPIKDIRYRPHRTLIQKEFKKPQVSENKVKEITSALEPKLVHDPVKCIPLPQSLEIQHDQAKKQMEGKVKRMFAGLNNLLVDDDSTDEDDAEEEFK